jgi:hypothetical protein
MYMMREIAVGFLIGSIAVLAACSSFDHEGVDLAFDNRTDSLLCFEQTAEGAAAGGCPQKIKPMSVTSGRVGCGYGEGADQIPLTVILIVAEGERGIFARTAECRAWQGSNREFTIEQRDGDFFVTSPLPDTVD